ncbi:tetratricopeptide repeat protein [Alteromonas sp. MmMcT2-2]|nr:tetratricopeptide repeat protein [Alteromonas sp. MmMcT2-2]
MVLNNLAWLHHVNSRNDRALEYAERAVKIEGENPDYLDTLGMIQLRMGSVADAESILNKAHSLASTNLTILLHYAEALVLSGKVKRAENLLSSFTGRSSELDQEIKRILESKRG